LTEILIFEVNKQKADRTKTMQLIKFGWLYLGKGMS